MSADSGLVHTFTARASCFLETCEDPYNWFFLCYHKYETYFKDVHFIPSC
jgi:hypothetical protein